MSVFYQQMLQYLSKLNQKSDYVALRKCLQNYVNYVM